MRYALISLLFVSLALVYAGCTLEEGNGDVPKDEESEGSGYITGVTDDDDSGENSGGEEVGDDENDTEVIKDDGSITDYKIQPGDILNIDGNRNKEINKQVKVDDKGYIKLLFISRVKVAGLTKWEAEGKLEKEYKDYFRDPQITVEIMSLSYFVGGEVRTPGEKSLTGDVTLTQAIVVAGGEGAFADLTKVTIRRTVDGKEVTLTYNCKKIRDGEADDPYVKPGDTVTVPR